MRENTFAPAAGFTTFATEFIAVPPLMSWQSLKSFAEPPPPTVRSKGMVESCTLPNDPAAVIWIEPTVAFCEPRVSDVEPEALWTCPVFVERFGVGSV